MTTYTVIYAPMKGPRHGDRFLGVAIIYLEILGVGDHLHVGVRPSRSGFHLLSDPSDPRTPIIMTCSGTGIAPFRSFVAERALKLTRGLEFGPAVLFYGCRRPEEDDFYFNKFQGGRDFRSQGLFKAVRHSENCRYVQDRLWADRSETARLYDEGAQVYICGAGAVGAPIEKTMECVRAEATGDESETVMKWEDNLKGERYFVDVFA